MSAILASKVPPELSKPSGSTPSFLRACWDGVVRYFESRAAIASLGELDECALRDIGITRSQIEAAVHGFLVPAPASAVNSIREEERRQASVGEARPWN